MTYLTIDIGNTLAKAGLFQNEKLIQTFENLELIDLKPLIQQYSPTHTMIASVRGKLEDVENELTPYTSLHIFTYQTPIPAQNLYSTPQTLGVDRLAAVIGAQYLFPAKACLVIDTGTCITYDFIDEKQQYWGGSISLGLNMRFKALHNFTTQLPLITLNPTEKKIELIGDSTINAIKSGVINGLLAEVEGIIEKYKKQFSSLEVIFCGGDAFFFETNIKQPIFVNPKLVLFGLYRILQYNVEKS